MIEQIELGPTPAMEECAQAGQPDYHERGRKECVAFVEQLERAFPVPMELASDVWFWVVRCGHDFGVYYEAAVKFNTDNLRAVDFAFQVERSTPPYWDQAALDKLYGSSVRTVVGD